MFKFYWLNSFSNALCPLGSPAPGGEARYNQLSRASSFDRAVIVAKIECIKRISTADWEDMVPCGPTRKAPTRAGACTGRLGPRATSLLPDSEVLVGHSEAQLSEEARSVRLARVDRDELPKVAGMRLGSDSAARPGLPRNSFRGRP